jgi:uncharacterized membrane protein HdeD (DUF308 family)
MTKPDKAMLVKGVCYTVLGLAVVAAPYVVGSGALRSITSSVSLVGWFVLAFGAMKIFRYIKPDGLKRRKKPLTYSVPKQKPPP